MSVVLDERVQLGAEPASARPGLVGRLLLVLLHGYQALRSGRPTGCRYVPSCSEFAEQAVTRHGAARGALLAIGRVARCGPWGGHGFDPVPDRRSR